MFCSMNPHENSEEPEFVRLLLPRVGSWVKAYRIAGGALCLDLTAERDRAGVFVSPSASDLEEIGRRFSPVQVLDATFAEWVEAGGVTKFP